MSDPRYQPGIIQGIALSRTPGGWPAEIPSLGVWTWASLGRCVVCNQKGPLASVDGGWVTYGGQHLCKRHARQLAEGTIRLTDIPALAAAAGVSP